MMLTTEDFVRESNRIEGILRDPTPEEIAEHDRFMALETPTIADLEHFVSIYQPGAILRDKPDLNVRVGNHVAPEGGKQIRDTLSTILTLIERKDPHRTHCIYESVHPFTDCNGRSGRVLWAWQMLKQHGGYPLGFLHQFYYQTLERHESRGKP